MLDYLIVKVNTPCKRLRLRRQERANSAAINTCSYRLVKQSELEVSKYFKVHALNTASYSLDHMHFTNFISII